MSDDDALDFVRQIASCSGPVDHAALVLEDCEHCGGTHALAAAYWTDRGEPRTTLFCPVAGLVQHEAVPA